jgi:hypothetical protein
VTVNETNFIGLAFSEPIEKDGNFKAFWKKLTVSHMYLVWSSVKSVMFHLRGNFFQTFRKVIFRVLTLHENVNEENLEWLQSDICEPACK